jgi:hypothetical protein
MKLAAAFPHLERFHRANSTCVTYQPPSVTSRDRFGQTLTSNPAPSNPNINALIDWELTPEQVTAFGDPSAFGPGRRAVFRVLACDLEPQKSGMFVLDGTTYSILAIQPLTRSGRTFRYDVLVGWE